MTRVKRPRTKRKACAHCKRVRLSKFIEWHPGIEEWQCSDFPGCDLATRARQAIDKLARYACRCGTGYLCLVRGHDPSA